jgi:putative phage-type endonuclease
MNDINTQNINLIHTNSEYEKLIKFIYNLIEDEIYKKTIIRFMCEPNFNDYFINYILEIVKITLSLDDTTDNCLIDEITNNLLIYYSVKGIPRCNGPTFYIINDPNIIDKKIKYLDNIPQPTQRTDEWYIYRQNLITASSAWKILKSESTLNQYIIDKCTPFNMAKYKNVNINSPLHKGVKYEPVSVMIYEYMYKTFVKDYGCIPHNKYNFIGASPDGINVDTKSHLYGRMLEIKNIVNREINGIPKYEYWIQMQLQMEVCNLDECDFLETYFKECEDIEEYNNKKNNYDFYGRILMFNNNECNPEYYYAPLYIDNDELEYSKWKDTIMLENDDKIFLKEQYYYLEKISCVLVKRNEYWFNSVISYFEDAYNIIQDEKIDNKYMKRIGVKNTKKNKKSPNLMPDLPNKKCFIDIDKLKLNEQTSPKVKKLNKPNKSNIILSLDTTNL